MEARRARWARETLAAAPAVGLFAGLALYRFALTPAWVGDSYDDAGYYLMSRNVWEYGRPLLDASGDPRWSASWSPALPVLLSPLAALPLDAGVVAQRIAVVLIGIAFVALAYLWLRAFDLRRAWAGAGAACVAAAFPTVVAGSSILSDVPAAAAIVAGVLLLRRVRFTAGVSLLVVAALLRPIHLVVLAAAALWLLLEHRSRRVAATLVAAFAATGGLLLARLLTGGLDHYVDEIAGHRGGSLPGRIVDQGEMLVAHAGGEALAGVFGSETLQRDARPLLVAALLAVAAAAALGLWRRRALLEALVVAGTVGAMLVYPTGPSLPRYLIPVTPFVVGGVAAALDRGGRAWTALATAAVAVALAGDVWLFERLTPADATRDHAGSLRAVYEWVGAELPPGSQIVAYNPNQAFLYSGRHTLREPTGDFPAGRTFVVDPEIYFTTRPKGEPRSAYRTAVVHRRGPVAVLRLDGRR